MKREPGFYWVKMRSTSKWVVSEFLYGGWHLPNYRFLLKDEHFEAIHETRLIPPREDILAKPQEDTKSGLNKILYPTTPKEAKEAGYEYDPGF